MNKQKFEDKLKSSRKGPPKGMGLNVLMAALNAASKNGERPRLVT